MKSPNRVEVKRDGRILLFGTYYRQMKQKLATLAVRSCESCGNYIGDNGDVHHEHGCSVATVETTTGMMMSVSRYNALSKIEQANIVVPEGIRIVVVHGKDELGFIFPPRAKLIAVFYALVHAIGEEGKRYELRAIRDSRGAILENQRAVGEYRFKTWERLFIEVFKYDGSE